MKRLGRTGWLVTAAALLAAGCGGAPGAEQTTADKAEPKEGTAMTDELISEISGELVLPKIWATAGQAETECGAAIAKAREQRDALVATAGPRTSDNTLLPMNDIQIRIDGVLPFSELMANVHPDKAVRDAAEKCQQDVMKLVSELQLDREVYDALSAVDGGGLDVAARRALDETLRDYRRSGVDKDEATRERLKSLHEQMVKTGQDYARRIREDKRYVEVLPKQLAGLPQDFLDSHPAGKNGKVRLTTDYPDYFPVLSYADSEDIRKALYVKFLERGYPENVETLSQLLALRHEYATLLGFPNWAEYNAEDKMARNEATIAGFIAKVADIGRPRMERDLAEILARKLKDVPKAKAVHEWDRFYYVKKIQSEKYGVDSQAVRRYFDYPLVKQGLLEVNQRLWGIAFERAADAPVWHASVEAWDVKEGGRIIGRFYLDMHPRDGKYGHAAMFNVVTGITGRQLPVATLVCNFPAPSDKGPALMEHGDVTTFFHEFGHLMHHLLGSGYPWANLSGISCEWDFVEVPSQLMEEWAWDPGVLSGFARHDETGEAIPEELVRKMKAADEFGKGVHVMRQMFFAALSFAFHNRDPKGVDLGGLLQETQRRYSPYPHEPGTWLHANFGHLEGYSSMYYTYMWSLVLSKDIFTRFSKAGLMDAVVAADYRKHVIGAGGAVDAADQVRNFLGRETSFDAFGDYLED
ncbi:MAG TPA: M3 family metallopeptidase [Polyangia bacterium]|nr:M3 family metallopeptidase [Polyangia bacterium]